MHRRSTIAGFIATLFVLGALVMPFTHYVWMSTSGYFGVQSAHAGMDMGSGLSGHGNLGASLDHPAIQSEKEQLCDYADLFASFASSSPSHQQGPDHLPTGTELIAATDLLQGRSDTLLPPMRGPPEV